MGTMALLDVFSYVAGHDFTADTNRASLQTEAVVQDASTFRPRGTPNARKGWRQIQGGQKSVTFEQGGFWSADDTDAVDPEAWDAFTARRRNLVHTFGPTEVERGAAYLWRGGTFAYQLLGELGELAPFTLSARGTDPVGVVRGQLAAAMGEVTAPGPLGTPVNLGPGAAGQHVYASLHTFTDDVTLTVAVEASADEAFTAPTTIGEFAPITGRGGYWLPRVDATGVAGPWYRLTATAISGPATVAGAIALQ